MVKIKIGVFVVFLEYSDYLSPQEEKLSYNGDKSLIINKR
jgi:hypothetical protein